MKAGLIIIASTILVAGCSKLESTGGRSYYAIFEQTETKTFVDNELHLYWTKNDQIGVFEGTTYHKPYIYTGRTGSNSASFGEVQTSGYVSGYPLTSNIANYAVYPYRTDTSISYDGVITYTFPAVQQYAPNTFGLEANVMVAVTENVQDNFLPFKNVGAYLVFKVYGEGTVIKSISLKSQAGEALAGNADITASHSSSPSVSSFYEDSDRSSTITLDCGDGIALGASSSEAKTFWFVIPPITLSNGYAVTFKGPDGSSLTRTASGSRTYARNKIYRVTAFEVKFSNPTQSYSPNGIDGLDETCFNW